MPLVHSISLEEEKNVFKGIKGLLPNPSTGAKTKSIKNQGLAIKIEDKTNFPSESLFCTLFVCNFLY